MTSTKTKKVNPKQESWTRHVQPIEFDSRGSATLHKRTDSRECREDYEEAKRLLKLGRINQLLSTVGNPASAEKQDQVRDDSDANYWLSKANAVIDSIKKSLMLDDILPSSAAGTQNLEEDWLDKAGSFADSIMDAISFETRSERNVSKPPARATNPQEIEEPKLFPLDLSKGTENRGAQELKKRPTRSRKSREVEEAKLFLLDLSKSTGYPRSQVVDPRSQVVEKQDIKKRRACRADAERPDPNFHESSLPKPGSFTTTSVKKTLSQDDCSECTETTPRKPVAGIRGLTKRTIRNADAEQPGSNASTNHWVNKAVSFADPVQKAMSQDELSEYAETTSRAQTNKPQSPIQNETEERFLDSFVNDLLTKAGSFADSVKKVLSLDEKSENTEEKGRSPSLVTWHANPVSFGKTTTYPHPSTAQNRPSENQLMQPKNRFDDDSACRGSLINEMDSFNTQRLRELLGHRREMDTSELEQCKEKIRAIKESIARRRRERAHIERSVEDRMKNSLAVVQAALETQKKIEEQIAENHESYMKWRSKPLGRKTSFEVKGLVPSPPVDAGMKVTFEDSEQYPKTREEKKKEFDFEQFVREETQETHIDSRPTSARRPIMHQLKPFRSACDTVASITDRLQSSLPTCA